MRRSGRTCWPRVCGSSHMRLLVGTRPPGRGAGGSYLGDDAMNYTHTAGVKPPAGSVELGRGADGIVIEVLDHPETVIKDMNHRFKLGRNRVALELRIL